MVMTDVNVLVKKIMWP